MTPESQRIAIAEAVRANAMHEEEFQSALSRRSDDPHLFDC
jgi:hypothetical protein